MRVRDRHVDVAAAVPTTRKRRKDAWRFVRRTGAIVGGLLAALIVLAVVNERFFPVPEAPRRGRTSHPAVWPASEANGIVLRVMTYNIWMSGARRGPVFLRPQHVAERVRRMGELIRAHRPDLVFLQEVAQEAGPGSFDQTPQLAEAAGMHMWSFGASVNTGLPFHRLVRGNAILSRWPPEVVANQPLPGRPLLRRIGIQYRTLWCRTLLGGREVLLASVHLTALFSGTRPRQMEQILDFVGDQPALLAGDFHAEPDRPALDRLLATDKFTAPLDGSPTYPSRAPRRQIDYLFAPADWQLLEYTVIPSDLSDHLPVLATYRVPGPNEATP